MKKMKNKQIKNFMKEGKKAADSEVKVSKWNINQILIGFLVFVSIGGIILNKTILKDSSFDLFPLICSIFVLSILIASFLGVDPSKKSQFFVEKGIGYGWTINPRNLWGFLIYLLLFLVTLLPYFGF
ncbi:hypothetical protein [Enterococcus sp. UD-01]|uniref:hypothetical protein n=1 Tax=Enterococcus sp. UD-01 TaxID=3373911 RepID=UPI003838E09C